MKKLYFILLPALFIHLQSFCNSVPEPITPKISAFMFNSDNTNEAKQDVYLSFYDSFGELVYRKTIQSDSYIPDFVASGQFLICHIRINHKQHTLKYIAP